MAPYEVGRVDQTGRNEDQVADQVAPEAPVDRDQAPVGQDRDRPTSSQFSNP